MKQNSTAVAVIIALFIFASPSFSVVSEMNIAPLKVKGGARPLGLGGAFVGIADDSNAVFYNPAGLARVKGINLSFGDAGDIIAAHAYPTGYGWTVGLGLLSYSTKDFLHNGKTCNYASNVLLFSIGSRLSFLKFIPIGDIWDRMDIGLSYKNILGATLRQSGEDDISARGWDIDAGLLYVLNDWTKIGIAAENMVKNDMIWSTGTEESASSSVKIGLAMKVIGDKRSPIYMDNNEFTLSSDIELPSGSESPSMLRLGGEWLYMGTWAARIGLDQKAKGDEAESDLTFGVGLKTMPWQVDLSYNKGLFEQGSSIYFSVLYWPEEWYFEARTREEIQAERARKAEEKRREEERRAAERRTEEARKAEAARVEAERIEAEERRKEEERKAAEKKEEIKEEDLVRYMSPSENIVTDDDSVEISGKVYPGSRVFINNNEAYVGADGEISARVPLEVGKNLIEIVAERSGKKKVITTQVLRKAKVVIAEEIAIEKEIHAIKPEEERVVREERAVAETEKRPGLTPAEQRELELRRARVAEEKRRIEARRREIEQKKQEVEEKKETIQNLATLGIIDIDPTKEYKLEERVRRGELAMWLAKAKGLTLTRLNTAPFKDVPLSSPLAPYVKAAADSGLMRGYPDGTFRPDRFVTESEAEVILKRFNNL